MLPHSSIGKTTSLSVYVA
uniref:Uncharacterized protein n=1 Tax=Arundo donax TaxID=35708 RepID=A0A0A9AFD7_ARUDO